MRPFDTLSVRAGNALYRVFNVGPTSGARASDEEQALWYLTAEEVRDRLVDLAKQRGWSVRHLLLRQRGCGRKTVKEIFEAIGGEPTIEEVSSEGTKARRLGSALLAAKALMPEERLEHLTQLQSLIAADMETK